MTRVFYRRVEVINFLGREGASRNFRAIMWGAVTWQV